MLSLSCSAAAKLLNSANFTVWGAVEVVHGKGSHYNMMQARADLDV